MSDLNNLKTTTKESQKAPTISYDPAVACSIVAWPGQRPHQTSPTNMRSPFGSSGAQSPAAGVWLGQNTAMLRPSHASSAETKPTVTRTEGERSFEL